jgi:antitoxin VapB
MSAVFDNPQTAKLFKNGRSQAVRLPKEFRFEGQTEVVIRREGNKVILEPKEESPKMNTWADFFEYMRTVDTSDFLLDREQPPPQERDFLFDWEMGDHPSGPGARAQQTQTSG